MTTIRSLRVLDVRFPTSAALDGSDAMNPDPDYSAAYVVLETDVPGLEGHGLTVTARVPLHTEPTPENVRYLAAKQRRMGHLLNVCQIGEAS